MTNAITVQSEEYLEAVSRINDRGQRATTATLSRELRVAAPSVLGMIRRLKKHGFIKYSRTTGVTLTASGVTAAGSVRRRHRLAERLLADVLKMPWERVHEVACRFEHVIDEEMEPYLLQALNHPKTCPHGNPINEEITSSDVRRLTDLKKNEIGFFRCVYDESNEVLSYLAALRLQPGAKLEVSDIDSLNGSYLVSIEGNTKIISREVADQLLLEGR